MSPGVRFSTRQRCCCMGQAVGPSDDRSVAASIIFVVPEAGMTLAELEAAVWSSVQVAARDAIVRGCQIIEADAQARISGSVTLDRRRPLDLLTRFGWVRLLRWYQKDRDRGGYHYPLDAVLGLAPRQHSSPWVIAQASMLAAKLSYREAAEFLSGNLGIDVDHRTLHSMVANARDSTKVAPRSSGTRKSRVRQ
jgi:hypothetical protein